MTIPFSSIIVDARARQDYGDLSNLIASIESVGLIHGIVLNKDPEGAYHLVAGGRRYAAMCEMGVQELHEGTTCDPLRLGFVFKENLRPDQLLEIELEENFQRKQMSWAEEVILIARVHQEKAKLAHLNLGDWGLRQTGALLGVSFGKVQQALRVAKDLLSGDKQILACTSMTDCVKVYETRELDLAQAELAKRAGLGKTVTNSLLADLGIGETPIESGSKTDQVITPVPYTGNERLTVNLSKRFFLGDSVNDIMPRMSPATFDHILTDIPYGVDMDNFDGHKNLERVAKEHDVAENLSLMPGFLSESFRLLKPSGFCVFFYDLDHHEKLQTWASEIGFAVQRWPLIWCKTHPCRNQAAQYNFTKSEEYAMVLRKPGATLVKPQPRSRIDADGVVERKHYMNPFAKPFLVWKWLLESIAIKGQLILDPFAGEMSSCHSAILLGYEPCAIELSPLHYNAGVERVKDAYRVLTTNNVEFI